MVTKLQRPVSVQGDDSKEHLGLVHVYTGNGKGKTTASLGLALRAVGGGLNVYMIQFLKAADTGELFTVQKYLPNMKIVQYGVKALGEQQRRIYEYAGEKKSTDSTLEKAFDSTFIFMADADEKEACRRALEHAKYVINSGQYDLVILDEVNCALDKGLIPIQDVLDIIKNHNHVELVLTGMDAPEEIKQAADYVSFVQKIKHPWEKGIKARKGVEY